MNVAPGLSGVEPDRSSKQSHYFLLHPNDFEIVNTNLDRYQQRCFRCATQHLKNHCSAFLLRRKEGHLDS